MESRTLFNTHMKVTVADLRGRKGRTPPVGVQILSTLCSFWEILAKSYVGAPLPTLGVGAASSGKSWIRYWVRWSLPLKTPPLLLKISMKLFHSLSRLAGHLYIVLSGRKSKETAVCVHGFQLKVREAVINFSCQTTTTYLWVRNGTCLCCTQSENFLFACCFLKVFSWYTAWSACQSV